ncbi:PhzF family phenazine biosynthesis protein [Salmonella enterica]|uniref:PhzF family phenazine biosynthesis protein n=1 Tax=Salmonella enterica TaxID=28901 RepID=UPI00071CE1F1|nr:PhzF family phenazine biosynthesis protein [Salmonella enterica]EAW3954137.1 PhzF family phenazine biosynthesis protein [Salmonella enterica subsp. enterica]EBM9478745.1 PhzF family phenazine biosynthesis protein [Salmonella enterica subsp. enterica serovar Rubislaw]ECT6469441.1 PhzF family phenazine biosynthesis protein [Salmonella enterica subsp. enterica serovar Senegal]EDC0986876.1 PhzF family phenazine biosynthesis protein [Salmonella enterica subsp. enterica serovar Give]EDI1814863.1 
MTKPDTAVIPFYQVDAFTSQPFGGNPAGVCPLTEWLPDDVLQAIATENNLSETAFFVPVEDGYQLRWCTPAVEVDLCGHATLAASWVLFNKLGYQKEAIRFHTRSGVLTVSKNGDALCMDFPAKSATEIDIPAGLLDALGITGGAIGVWQSDDLIVLVDDKSLIDALNPDFNKLAVFNTRGVIVTAADNQFDFVSRWFGPQVGVNEDPVTGSAHAFLAPFWAARTGKNILTAQQGGKRKGTLRCVVRDDGRVELHGRARMTIEGVFQL